MEGWKGRMENTVAYKIEGKEPALHQWLYDFLKFIQYVMDMNECLLHVGGIGGMEMSN
ncbi:hypothetical protein [Chitinophaga sancti]|uniref:hypothetical protein n=1 Tax=Chitinophaga sancti TaxID=1004 RepID=UPI003F7ADE6C